MTFTKKSETPPREDTRRSFSTKLKEKLSNIHYETSVFRARVPANIPVKAPTNDENPQRPKIPAASLLGLPLELRNMIYTHLSLTHNTFHILWRANTHPNTTTHKHCSQPCSSRDPDYCTCLSGRTGFYSYPRYTNPLLHVSRALANDTLTLLYTRNTFAFGPDLNTFCLFTRTIGAHNLRAIRDIRITWPVSTEFYPAPYVEAPGLWVEGIPAWEAVKILRGGFGRRVRLRICLRETNQQFHSVFKGLWARRYWFEPLTYIGAGSGDDEREIEIEIEAGKPDGRVSWRDFREDIKDLVRKGEGLQRPWGTFRMFGFDVCVSSRKARVLKLTGWPPGEDVSAVEDSVLIGGFSPA